MIAFSLRTWQARRRIARRDSAVRGYLAAGWAIGPGSWWDDSAPHRGRARGRYRCSNPSCLRPGSLHPDGDGPLVYTPDAAAWAHTPATVLLATGHGVDAVQVGPLPHVDAVRAWALARHRGPIVSTAGSLFLLCEPSSSAAARPVTSGPARGAAWSSPRVGEWGGRLLVHERGSWIPLPPSRTSAGDVAWVRHPDATGWRLPARDHLLDQLAAAHRDGDPDPSGRRGRHPSS